MAAPVQLLQFTPTFFHHNQPVSPITDAQPVERNNDARIEESRCVPVSQDGHRIR